MLCIYNSVRNIADSFDEDDSAPVLQQRFLEDLGKGSVKKIL